MSAEHPGGKIRHLQLSQSSGSSVLLGQLTPMTVNAGVTEASPLALVANSMRGCPRSRGPGGTCDFTASLFLPSSSPASLTALIEDYWLHLSTRLVKIDCVKWQILSVFHNDRNSWDICKKLLKILNTWEGVGIHKPERKSAEVSWHSWISAGRYFGFSSSGLILPHWRIVSAIWIGTNNKTTLPRRKWLLLQLSAKFTIKECKCASQKQV